MGQQSRADRLDTSARMMQQRSERCASAADELDRLNWLCCHGYSLPLPRLELQPGCQADAVWSVAFLLWLWGSRRCAWLRFGLGC